MAINLLAAPPGRRLDLGHETFGPRAVQLGLDELGTPLAETTFVVVDLETTGCSPRSDAITEVGAVKVKGGVVLGEFQTLVDPGGAIPPTITVLTGITNAMVIDAPRIEAVLPSFLEFAAGAVLVAHNARFDVSFLVAAAERSGLQWPRPRVVDTVALARRVVTRDESPNHKLSSLATLFRSEVVPEHRALADARATVDVLHALLGRLGPLGVTHLEDLLTAADPVPPARRRKAHLAAHLPDAPGVYEFIGPNEEVLYVGTAVNIRRRVRSYFTASESRSRMGEMLALAAEVRAVVCATVLESRVRELRLIAEHKPPYNRVGRHPERRAWLRLTDEAAPRLAAVGAVPRGARAALGPFPSRRAATEAAAAIQDVLPIRRCTQRLPHRPRPEATACILAELARCAAPCLHGAAVGDGSVAAVREALEGAVGRVAEASVAHIRKLAAAERFEDAAQSRDQLTTLLRAALRGARLRPVIEAAEIVAARRETGGGWEVVLARFGRLAGTAVVPRGADPMPAVHALRAAGERVGEPESLGGAAAYAETELIVEWLEQPGVRLVDLDSPSGIAWPVVGPGQAFSALRLLGAG